MKENTMSQASKKEYTEMQKKRYMRNKSCLYRKNLLDEYCRITAHERKYAQKLLSGKRGNNGAQKEIRA